MSVLTEINRIKNAVTAIVNAIKGKGVTVPSGTKIDGLASLVSSIPTSSDLPVYDLTPLDASYDRDNGNTFTFSAVFETPTKVNDELIIAVPKSDFGNAKASDVKAGVTFTSADGVNETGTMPEATPPSILMSNSLSGERLVIKAQSSLSSAGYMPTYTKSSSAYVDLTFDGDYAVVSATGGSATIRKQIPNSGGSSGYEDFIGNTECLLTVYDQDYAYATVTYWGYDYDEGDGTTPKQFTVVTTPGEYMEFSAICGSTIKIEPRYDAISLFGVYTPAYEIAEEGLYYDLKDYLGLVLYDDGYTVKIFVPMENDMRVEFLSYVP